MPNRQETGKSREPIAIVGIGCRFPGRANDPLSFWKLLENGGDAVTDVPADRWNSQAFYDPDSSQPGKTSSRWGGFVENIDHFDPHFFGISPREAARMDPQQRLLLEVAWEGLEDGGLSLDRISGTRASVFVGISSFDYSILETSFRDRGAIDVYSNTGGSLSIAANRISYCFDFRGPSLAVDTACSSALVAVHLACESIWRDGCPLALAGGVNALLMPDWYVGFSRMGMLSPDGRCRAFDAKAGGFVRSEGAGVVVLKPLATALAEGDRVYAVIRGSAVNQDGRTPGMTMPSQEGQEALLRQACRTAEMTPDQIQYVEAHGTGTLVGDPIEARALGRVLSAGRPEGQPCLIGSVKTNIGHLEAGSGIAGLIKVALALHHRRIPGNLHFDHPNPDIDFDGLGLRVPTSCEPWPDGDGPASAGVNSFGFGGTNAHVLLQEAPPVEICGSEHEEPETACLVTLSARSPEALRAMARSWSEDPVKGSVREMAAALAFHRTHHEHRLAIIVRSKAEWTESLAEVAAGQTVAQVSEGRAIAGASRRLAFVCSGQGPQWWGMGRQLIQDEPVFRLAINRCDAIVRRLGPWSLLDEMTADEADSRIESTAIAQPCLFAIQVALADLWASWGVRPASVVGHSVGEVAAAYLAGVFDLEDAVRIIYHRGRCMELAPDRGRMLAAGVSPDEALALIAGLGDRVSLAAVNSPSSVTLSGEAGPLEEVADHLEKRGVFHRFLKVQYAFHSAQMDPIRDELRRSLVGIRPGVAKLPLFSTVTGQRVEGPELGPDYWWRNVRQAVQFADGVGGLVEANIDLVIELGPHPVLSASVIEGFQARGRSAVVLPSLRRQHDERATMLRSLGELYALGHPIDWAGVYPGPRRFLRLPLYPWQRERCWHESEESRASRLTPPAHPLLGTTTGGPRPSWEGRLDLRSTPYLADHRVRKAAILPATAYLEMAFAASREATGTDRCELRDVNFANPCFLETDRPLWTRSDFDPKSRTFQYHTRPLDDARAWTAHLSAEVHPLTDDLDERSFSPDVIQSRCPRAFHRERSYVYLQSIGLDYGPMFQGIEEVWQGDRESLGRVWLPEALAGEADHYLFHPALLDACLQVVISADGDFDGRNGGLYLPSEVDQVQFFRKPGRRVWVHAVLREKTSRQSVADIDVHDEQGRLVVRVRGLHSRCVSGGRQESLESLLYAYGWMPQPVPAAGSPDGPGWWLILADDGGLGLWLASRLRMQGDSCVIAVTGASFETCGEGRYRIDPGHPDDMKRLVASACAKARTPCRGVVHLWNLDAAPPDRLDAVSLAIAEERGVLSVVHLVQAWDQEASDQTAPLFLVTRGAQSVGDRPEPVAVGQGPAIGLGRVIAGEYSRLACKLVDLDPLAGDGGLRTLLQEIQGADDQEDEVAWRGETRSVHRFWLAPDRPAGDVARIGTPYRLAIRQAGSIDGLEARTLRRRPPGTGEVEIEVFAAGLNFSDVMKVLNLYPGLADGPVPLGAECSGRITAVGEGVTDVKVGDDVLAVAGFAFGSHVVTRKELVAPKPSRISFEEAATLPIAFLTAVYALEHLGRLGQGESVLIHSASGGVGLAAVQIARRAGARVFATAGTSEKRDYLRALGIETVMDSRSFAFADEIRNRTEGRGVDVILNSLPGEAIARGIAALADYGRFLEIGKRDIYGNARLGLQPFHKNLSFFAIDLDRVMRERPAMLGSMLRDVAQRVDARTLEPLPHGVWPVAETVDAFRYMQKGKHIGKVVLSFRDQDLPAVPSEDDSITFRADGSYLIAGGLGGFGLAVARWMAGHGAGTLILLGRRGVSTLADREAIAEMESLGARVIILAADVARAEDVAAVLAEIDRDLPPLRGVLHAAMVLEDSLLMNLGRDLLQRVMAPKVSGAWNLHSQTIGRPLDFFVLFSSLSSVFGHAGQGNYAAANAFLDALAWHRRATGLPALCVNWGYLGDTGYLARRGELGERLERQGVLSFTVEQALHLLEKAMLREHIQVSVMRMDWTRWRGLGVTGRVSPRFAHLCQRAEVGQNAPGSLTGPMTLQQVSPADRVQVLEVRLRDKLARVLGTAPDRLDGDRPLLQLGIDSLMAVELRNWIEGELKVNLPIVDLMRSPSVSRLAAQLSERFATGEPTPSSDHRNTPLELTSEHQPAYLDAAAASGDLLARVDDLSGEQVDALLATLLDARLR